MSNTSPLPRPTIRPTLRKVVLAAATAVLFVGLAYAYYYPGSQIMLDGRVDAVMSDGTDPLALPIFYDRLIATFHEHPSRFFYGNLVMTGFGPESESPQWVPWNERWLIVALAPMFNSVQLHVALVIVLALLTALSMGLLARAIGWSRSLAVGLAISWGFSAYCRARAKTHPDLAGVFHVPLIFLGVWLATRRSSRASLAGAAVALLLASTSAHYYVVTMLFLSPFFIAYAALESRTRKEAALAIGRLLVAALPTVLFLGFSFIKPIPSDVVVRKEELFRATSPVPETMLNPFLTRFAARPIDYLTSDLSLAIVNGYYQTPQDLNPLRGLASQDALKSMNGSNPHERTNGIRWSILILGILGIVSCAGPLRQDRRAFRNVIFFGVFGFFTFLLSLSPDAFPSIELSPAYWMNSVIRQVRVPSRAGINVHFALLMATGFFLAASTPGKLKWRHWLLLPGAFPLLMLLDYPPLVQPMPIARVMTPYVSLSPPNPPCGTGMLFPPLIIADEIPFYQFQSRLRGTGCVAVNESVPLTERLREVFPMNPAYLQGLAGNVAARDQLLKFSSCAGLRWIAIHPGVLPREWAMRFCEEAAGTLDADQVCVVKPQGEATVARLQQCLGLGSRNAQ